MKVAYINKLAHLDPEWVWIKTKSGLPVGPFRAMFNLKKPHKVLNSLMVYSQIISPSLTPNQWKKFHSSVVKVRGNPTDLFDLASLTLMGLNNAKITSHSDDRVSRMLLSNVRSPSISGGKMKTSVLNPKDRIRTANHFDARDYINKHYPSGLPKWFMDEIHKNWSSVNSVHDGMDSKGCVGRISFIQEPGYKLRAIANPLPIFQILLDPLKRTLLDTLRLIPNDFTHDQDAGVDYVQRMLTDGFTTSSVDLSDATNHLPLTDQMNVLRALFGATNPDLDLFEKVSKSGWLCDGPDGEEILHWGTGQPLGLGPSFPSFALYHHFIMRYVISLYEGSNEPIASLMWSVSQQVAETEAYNYAIVGDDIVMDSIYTDIYIRVIESLDCKISYDKCLFKANVAEFCSRIITKRKIFRAYKWRAVSDNSFISMCKAFGPNITSLLRPRQKAIAQRIGEIPDTLGGPIGWNPDGKCLAQREAELWRLAEELNSLSIDEDISVPKAEIHFRLKQELGLIRFPSYSVNDYVNGNIPEIKVEAVSSRLRFVHEVLFQYRNGASLTVSLKVARSLYLTNESQQMMNEYERKLRNFTFPISSRKDHVDGDFYVKKLYTLLFKD
jgi:hypothetical protein